MSNLSFNEAINNLSDNDVKVRKEAIESLVGTTDETAIEPLIKATTDENAQVRFKAAEILGSMGDVAVDKLIDEFKNADGKGSAKAVLFVGVNLPRHILGGVDGFRMTTGGKQHQT